MKTWYVLMSVSVLGALLALPGCLTDGSGTESGSTVVTAPTQNPVASPTADPTRTVCDPFQTNSPQARDRGLVGNLFYLTDSQPRYSNITDFMNNAVVVDASIYLDRMYIPTRPFDRGFYLQSGSLVTNANGQPLYEYFGIRLTGKLQLAANENPGRYQLAVLADDGALLKIPDGLGGQKIIVNDDGTHATRMKCATEPVYLDHTTQLPITMEYYQGPRYHIALVAMWRPWPDGVTDTNPVNDPFCGQEGNSLFFDSTQDPVVSKPPFHELLARNWKVLENDNYVFPDQSNNPCTPPEDILAISNFSLSNVARDQVTLTWTTNVSSSSQGESKVSATGVVTLSQVDSTPVQSHSLTITGLAPNTLYVIRALSTSPGGQNAVSDERSFRTLR